MVRCAVCDSSHGTKSVFSSIFMDVMNVFVYFLYKFDCVFFLFYFSGSDSCVYFLHKKGSSIFLDLIRGCLFISYKKSLNVFFFSYIQVCLVSRCLFSCDFGNLLHLVYL